MLYYIIICIICDADGGKLIKENQVKICPIGKEILHILRTSKTLTKQNLFKKPFQNHLQ